MANVWSGVTIDCLDPERVARFWSALLGREAGPSQEGWVHLGKRSDPQPRLVFQPVSEPAIGKVRIHLDVSVDDIDEAVATMIGLGGRTTGERHDYDAGVVVVMTDPENHEFCLVQYYDYGGNSPAAWKRTTAAEPSTAPEPWQRSRGWTKTSCSITGAQTVANSSPRSNGICWNASYSTCSTHHSRFPSSWPVNSTSPPAWATAGRPCSA
jgi:predicted enzyme related to lactoylglutathione lyase